MKMFSHQIKVDKREPATLTAELTYLEYEVDKCKLKAGDFEGQHVIGEIKRNGTNNDFFQSILDKRILNQPKKMIQKKKKPFVLVAGDPADIIFSRGKSSSTQLRQEMQSIKGKYRLIYYFFFDNVGIYSLGEVIITLDVFDRIDQS